MRHGIFVGMDDALVSAAEVFAVATPAAIEPNNPPAPDWKRHTVVFVGGAAKIRDHDHIVAYSASIPAVVADNAVVIGGVEKGGRIALQAARCIVSVVP